MVSIGTQNNTNCIVNNADIITYVGSLRDEIAKLPAKDDSTRKSVETKAAALEKEIKATKPRANVVKERLNDLVAVVSGVTGLADKTGGLIEAGKKLLEKFS